MSALRLAALAATLSVVSSASAHATPSALPLSAIPQTKVADDLPAAPEGTKLPGVHVKVGKPGNQPEVRITQTSPACLFYADATQTRPTWIEPGMSSTYGTSFRADRIVSTGDRTELERSMLEVSGEAVRVVGRQRIPLTPVARDATGLVVYAYRTAGELFVLAPSGAGASYRSATGSPLSNELDPSALFGTYDCGFVAARINLRAPAGASAVLAGPIAQAAPPDKAAPRRFVVNASVSKVARDPEPLLSVNLRVIEP